jgi:hypothetical protein
LTADIRKFRLVFLAVLAVLVLVAVPAALAGKGGGGGGKGPGGGGSGGTSSISLAPLVNDVNGDGLPNFGDTVMFNVSTTATTQPYVHLQCYQNGVRVIEGWRGYFADSLDYPYFGLWGGTWAGGAADCTADLMKGTTAKGYTELASTSFHVNA